MAGNRCRSSPWASVVAPCSSSTWSPVLRCSSTACSATRWRWPAASPASGTSPTPSSGRRRWSWPRWWPSGYGARGGWWPLGVLAAVLLVDGLPMLGADVGGVLSMVPAFGLTALVLLGRPVGVRQIAGLVAAVRRRAPRRRVPRPGPARGADRPTSLAWPITSLDGRWEPFLDSLARRWSASFGSGETGAWVAAGDRSRSASRSTSCWSRPGRAGAARARRTAGGPEAAAALGLTCWPASGWLPTTRRSRCRRPCCSSSRRCSSSGRSRSDRMMDDGRARLRPRWWPAPARARHCAARAARSAIRVLAARRTTGARRSPTARRPLPRRSPCWPWRAYDGARPSPSVGAAALVSVGGDRVRASSGSSTTCSATATTAAFAATCVAALHGRVTTGFVKLAGGAAVAVLLAGAAAGASGRRASLVDGGADRPGRQPRQPPRPRAGPHGQVGAPRLRSAAVWPAGRPRVRARARRRCGRRSASRRPAGAVHARRRRRQRPRRRRSASPRIAACSGTTRTVVAVVLLVLNLAVGGGVVQPGDRRRSPRCAPSTAWAIRRGDMCALGSCGSAPLACRRS